MLIANPCAGCRSLSTRSRPTRFTSTTTTPSRFMLPEALELAASFTRAANYWKFDFGFIKALRVTERIIQSALRLQFQDLNGVKRERVVRLGRLFLLHGQSMGHACPRMQGRTSLLSQRRFLGLFSFRALVPLAAWESVQCPKKWRSFSGEIIKNLDSNSPRYILRTFRGCSGIRWDSTFSFR